MIGRLRHRYAGTVLVLIVLACLALSRVAWWAAKRTSRWL